MKQSEFTIGIEFMCGEQRWRCTDIGIRTILAICISQVKVTRVHICGTNTTQHEETLTYETAKKEGWFDGPPYGVTEKVFNENDFLGCAKI